MRSVSELDPEQVAAAKLCIRNKRAGVFLDMNFGKTAVALTVIKCLMYDRFTVRRTLVVAPPNVAESVWAEEAAQWEHLRVLDVVEAVGTVAQREKKLALDADVYVISVNVLPWFLDNYGLDAFDMVVLDEASVYKNPQGVYSKALRKALEPRHRVLALTGTPHANTVESIFGILKILDGGERLGTSITQFRKAFMVPLSGRGHIVYSWGAKPDAIERIIELTKDICFSLPPRDYQKAVRTACNVPLSKSARTAIKQYVKQCKEGIESEADQLALSKKTAFKAKNLLASSAGVLSGIYRQAIGGAVHDRFGEGVRVLHDEKMAALKAKLKSYGKDNVIIVYEYTHERERILKALPGAVLYAGDEQKLQWNAGRIRHLLLHPGSAAHGLNLQFGGHRMLFFTIPRSYERYAQVCKRLPRRGQKHTVLIDHLVCKGTADEDALGNVLQHEDSDKAYKRGLERLLKG